jgi:hypothetical protein
MTQLFTQQDKKALQKTKQYQPAALAMAHQ